MSLRNLTQDFHPSRLMPNLTAGLVAGIIMVMLETSFAALIFSGELSGYISNGIGLTLFAAMVICLVVALTSSLPAAIAVPQDSPAAILALVAAEIAASLTSWASSEVIFLTVVAAIALTSLLTGACFLLFGRFRLGNLVRFVPYPVVGGVLAGTGWLLVSGSIGVMTGIALSFSQLATLFQPAVLWQWLPGLIFAAALVVVLRRYHHFLIMPLMILGAIGLFYACLALAHVSAAQASANGWLLGPFPQGSLWQPLTPSALSQVRWEAILGQWDKICTIVVISMISLLLYSGALELIARKDMDLNRELRSAGLANLAAGLLSGPVGYQTLSLSALGHRMSANSRLVGIFAAALCGLTMFFGASLLSFFPRPVLGGLLLFLGLTFLVEWVYDAWFKLPRMDYFLVLLILAVIGVFGFLEGVGLGIILAVVLFVVNYSRINVVQYALSGAIYHSNVDRPQAQARLLVEKGEQLLIIRLTGFIFFGTAQYLLDQIRKRIKDVGAPPLRFVVLGFKRVTGLDSSAVSSFVRMQQLAELYHMQLVFTDLTGEMQCQLEMGGLECGASGEGKEAICHFLPNLDLGVEWCENQVLAAEGAGQTEAQESLLEQLEKLVSSTENAARLMLYLQRMEVGEGYSLMSQGEAADALYFIESGQVTIQLELLDGKVVRIHTRRQGTVVGEVGVYMNSIRTSSVIATQPSTLYRLSTEAMQKMGQDDPELAAVFHKFIARLLAERLSENLRTLEAVLD